MTLNASILVPPRLTMTEYARWVGENWKDGNLAQMKRQKDLEERIEKPFRIPIDEPIPLRAEALW